MFRSRVAFGRSLIGSVPSIETLVLVEGSSVQTWIMSDGEVRLMPHDGKGPEHYRSSPMWEEL